MGEVRKAFLEMSTIESNRLLNLRSAIIAENAALKKAVGGPADATASAAASVFTETFGDAVKAVNAQQQRASDISAKFERGETHDLVSVMIERQKASLGFEATLQVRNKLLSAYRDIMNMPV